MFNADSRLFVACLKIIALFGVIYGLVYWGVAGMLYGDGKLIRLDHHLMQPTSYALWCWIIGSRIAIGVAAVSVILVAMITKLGQPRRVVAVGITVAVVIGLSTVLLWITWDPRHLLSPVPIWKWIRNG